MAKKSVSGDSRDASENIPMTIGQIATAVAKSKTKDASKKRAIKTAALSSARGRLGPRVRYLRGAFASGRRLKPSKRDPIYSGNCGTSLEKRTSQAVYRASALPFPAQPVDAKQALNPSAGV
jgi:hypothetical protein